MVKESTAPNSPHTYYGRGAILYWRLPYTPSPTLNWRQLSMWRASEPGGRPCQGGRLEAVQRAPNTQVHPASRAMEAHQGDGVLYSQGESYVGRVGGQPKLGALSSP